MALAAIGSATVIALSVDAVVTSGAGHSRHYRMHHFAGSRCAATVKARRACMTRDAVGCSGWNVSASLALSAAGALAGVRTVVAGVAAAGADRRVAHCVSRETCRRVGVTVAALNPWHRDMRRRDHTGRRRAVVAARAIGVGRGVHVDAARPAGEGCCRARVAGDAIGAVGRYVAGERRCAHRALRPLAGVGPIVARITPAGADRRVIHRVGREARSRIVVAVAALDSRHRNVRRRLHAGRSGAVVAARAVGIGCRVGERSARPAGERRSRARVAGHAILAAGRHVAGERRRTLGALRSLSRV